MKALIDQYSDEEFKQIVALSKNMTDVAKKLGYAAHSGSNAKRIRQRIDELGISTKHFMIQNQRPIKRTKENVFMKDSSAHQATLRKWYKKGNYTPYICSICGQEPVWQNKDLTLILDHINGHNKDNRLENLRWVCPNCNQQLETTNGKNKKRKYSTKKYYCKDCGKEVSSSHTIRCAECYAKYVTQKPEDLPVTREELKNLIRTTSFLQIGSKFNVSDNTIRKWCDKLQLPRKKSDIKKLTDAEWLKI